MKYTIETPRICREWAMPSRHTFEIKPISDLLDYHLDGLSVVVDPFCGRSKRATHRNDLSQSGGVRATDYLDSLIDRGVTADAVLLDPPYSPRQISECYKSVGLEVSGTDTQNARLYAECIERMDRLLKPGGIAIRCGWNSCGFGKGRGYEMLETLIVCHGGAHNDTIVTVERKGEIAHHLPASGRMVNSPEGRKE